MAKELLSDVSIRNAKPNGAKCWLVDYAIGGKRKTLSLGTYPDTSLANARTKAAEARNSIANGTDPSDTRKDTKAAQKLQAENDRRLESGLTIIDSFEHIAREWGQKHVDTWAEKTIDQSECLSVTCSPG